MTLRPSFQTFAFICLSLFFLNVTAVQALNVTPILAPNTKVKAWVVTENATPIISFSMIFKGGATLEPESKQGITRLVSTLLDEGAGDLEALVFQQKLEDYAIQFKATAQHDYFHIRFATLTEHQDIAFDLLRKALNVPHFKPDAIDRMRTPLLVSLKQAQTNPHALLDDAWRDQTFANHVYQRKLRGRERDLKTITQQDLKAYHKTLMTRQSVAIGITGDISSKKAEEVLDYIFAPMPETRQSHLDIPVIKPVLTPALSIINHDFAQSNALFTQQAPNRKDPDFFAAYVVNHILGGSGFTSHLTQKVRDEKGLAYSVSSYLNPMQFSAVWQGSVATQADRMSRSIEIIRNVWQNMHQNGPTAQELEDAKTYLTGSYVLGFTSNGAVSSRLAAYQYQNLSLADYQQRNQMIENVTLADAKRVAQKWLSPDMLSFIVVGKDWQKAD